MVSRGKQGIKSDFPALPRPNIGDVVAICAVDWGFESDQHPPTAGFTIVRGTLFGMVIVVNDEWVTIAPQVFESGDVRCALSIPWMTVTQLVVLQKTHSLDMPGATQESKP